MVVLSKISSLVHILLYWLFGKSQAKNTMNTELVNLYVDKLLNEVGELTKTRLLLEAQLKYTEMMNIELKKKNDELEQQIEKLNKRKSKKEVDTSDDQF
jgi:septal ring factor EnvC (AmiA/AmiB activator)